MTPDPDPGTPDPTKKHTPRCHTSATPPSGIPVQLKERIDSALAGLAPVAGAGLRPSCQAFQAEIPSAHLDESRSSPARSTLL